MMMPRLLRELLQLPAYLYGVTVLFWCFQGASLTGFLKWWRMGPRNDVQAALEFLKAAFRYCVLRLPGPDMHKGKCMYLTNHRGWSDFFIDMWATGANAVPLSRRAVGMAFPAFTSSLIAIKSILLFNRSGIKDTEKFNAWLDRELAEGPQNSLLVYPEGKRSLKTESLPLKRGMLRYAFTRRLPVQAVIISNKEEVLSERRRWAHFGRTLLLGCSEVLESSKFEDFDEFMGAVQQLWDREWARVHAAQPHADLPVLVPRFPTLNYSPATLAIESAALGFWTAVLLSGAYYAVRLLAALAGSGGAGAAAVTGLALYTAASLAAAAFLPPPPPSSSSSRRGSRSRSFGEGSSAPSSSSGLTTGGPSVAAAAAAADRKED